MEKVPETRSVYLPEGNGWYDFWTKEFYDGFQTLEAAAPLETIPLFVRAGTILPMGEVEQFSGEKPNAPLAVHVYTGADASFVWYEDAGDTYAYENGECSRVMLSWDEAEQKLSISDRVGSFEGLVTTRTLEVKFHTLEGLREVDIEYRGSAIEV